MKRGLLLTAVLVLLCSCGQDEAVQPKEPEKKAVSHSAEDLERLDTLAEFFYRVNTCDAQAKSRLRIYSTNFVNSTQKEKALIWAKTIFGSDTALTFFQYEKKYSDILYKDEYKYSINCDRILQKYLEFIVNKEYLESNDIDNIGKILSSENYKAKELERQKQERKNAHVAIAEKIRDISRQERTLAKGQYEKTDDFKKRVETTRLAIEQKIDFEYPLKSSYDVDKETLTFTKDLSLLVWNYKFRNFPENKAITFLMDSSRTDLGKYIGENAFGVTRTIEKSRSESYEIVIINPEFLAKYYKVKDKYHAEFRFGAIQCPPNEAKNMESKVQNGTIIAQVSVMPRRFTNKTNHDVNVYVGDHYFSQSATLDDPRDRSETDYYLHANLISLQVIDKESGKIYFQLNSKQK